MKAYVLDTPGGAENLTLKEIPVSSPAEGQVLVKVKAISINPVDVKTRAGYGFYSRFKDADPLILGWDISGTVEQIGEGVSDLKPGDNVFGMVNFPGLGKAYAEYVNAPAAHLALIPKNVNFESAAAATLAALTAYQVLVKQAKVGAGDKVLIPAASGGVGHFAVQIAKHLGAHVTGTSSAKNMDFVMSLGADEHIDYNLPKLDEKIGAFEFVFDTVGGDNTDRFVPLVKAGGSLISIPSPASEATLARAKTLGVEASFYLVKSDGEGMKEIAGLMEAGIIKSQISGLFPFDKLPEAHLAVESGRTTGKVVVTV